MVDKNELKERLKSQAGNIISMVGFQMKDIKRKPRRKEHAQRLADLAAALHSAAETLISVEKLEAIEAAKKAEAERFERFSKMVENAAHEKKESEDTNNGNDQKN